MERTEAPHPYGFIRFMLPQPKWKEEAAGAIDSLWHSIKHRWVAVQSRLGPPLTQEPGWKPPLCPRPGPLCWTTYEDRETGPAHPRSWPISACPSFGEAGHGIHG